MRGMVSTTAAKKRRSLCGSGQKNFSRRPRQMKADRRPGSHTPFKCKKHVRADSGAHTPVICTPSDPGIHSTNFCVVGNSDHIGLYRIEKSVPRIVTAGCRNHFSNAPCFGRQPWEETFEGLFHLLEKSVLSVRHHPVPWFRSVPLDTLAGLNYWTHDTSVLAYDFPLVTRRTKRRSPVTSS